MRAVDAEHQAQADEGDSELTQQDERVVIVEPSGSRTWQLWRHYRVGAGSMPGRRPDAIFTTAGSSSPSSVR